MEFIAWESLISYQFAKELVRYPVAIMRIGCQNKYSVASKNAIAVNQVFTSG